MTNIRREVGTAFQLFFLLCCSLVRAPVFLVGASVIEVACLKAVPVIGPTVSCVSTIVADALRGMSLDDILKDAGPQCVQSVDQIIAILVGEAARNPMVRDTAAYRDQRTGAWIRAAQP